MTTQKPISSKNEDALDTLLAEIERVSVKRIQTIRKSISPYLPMLVEVLTPYGRSGVSRQTAIAEMERRRQQIGIEAPPKFEESIQSLFNRYCVDSAVFKKRNAPEEGLFFCPGGSGSGYWAVDVIRARPYLQKKERR